MQPVVFSLKRANETGNGWYRDGTNINYYPSNFTETECSAYFTLEFQIEFSYDNDYVTLSQNIPYSYSKLINFINACKQSADNNGISFK